MTGYPCMTGNQRTDQTMTPDTFSPHTDVVDRINHDQHIERRQKIVAVDIIKRIAGMQCPRRQFSQAVAIEIIDEQQSVEWSDERRIVDIAHERSILPIAGHQVARLQSLDGSLSRFHVWPFVKSMEASDAKVA